MRLVGTRRFVAGTPLGRDVPPNAGEAPLLRAGLELTEAHREALLRAGINAIYVDDGVSADIEVVAALSDRTRSEARSALQDAFRAAPAVIAGGGTFSNEQMRDFTDVVEQIAAEISSVGDASLALSDLAASDAYTMEHTIDVTVVGLLVARHLFQTRGRVDWRGERSYDRLDHHLTQLGVGLFLHDIGKLAIPAGILHKPGPLSDEEWELIRQHPEIGIQMVPSDAIWPRAKDVIRSHHERWDGSGYPRGLEGGDIQPFSRIAAVADVFDAITSERSYAAAQPQHVGVETIRAGAGTLFCPEVVDAFVEVVPPYPPGDEIVLADGSEGIVVSVPPKRVDQPLVRVVKDADGNDLAEPYEVALSERPALMPRKPEPAVVPV
jgi:HD-GYP domain-containing protein (c-di-GMP phosphodiesterase class II)